MNWARAEANELVARKGQRGHIPAMNRAKDWLNQAENDFLWAEETVEFGRFAQACFVCQQSAKKALKAIALYRGFDRVRSHSTMEIARSLQINDDVEQAAKRLDQYYISSRYPDAFPAGAPFEYFTKAQATEALGFAKVILERARQELVQRVQSSIRESSDA